MAICPLLVDLEFARSKGEARRLIAQRAVRVDGNVIDDVGFEFQRKLHRVIEVGKSRIAEVEFEPSTGVGP
jgi:tyrosyl-tRNA synthetase